MLMNKDDIKKVIPHREPMLMVDKVYEMVPDESIKAGLFLDPDLEFFKGHFPDEPVMPGVLTVESMAQASDVLLLSMNKYEGLKPLFIGIDQVKFKRKIVPGDEITIESKIVKVNEEKAVLTCEAVVSNQRGEETTTGLVTLCMRP